MHFQHFKMLSFFPPHRVTTPFSECFFVIPHLGRKDDPIHKRWRGINWVVLGLDQSNFSKSNNSEPYPTSNLEVLQKCSRIWMKLSSFGIYHILFNHTKNQQILRIYFVLNDSRLGIVMKSNSSPHLVQNWSIRWFSWKIPLLGSTQIWLALVGTNRPVSLLESCSLATKTFSQIRLVRSKLWKVF